MFKCICHCTRLIRTFPFSEGEDVNPGRPGLYSQTSSRPYGVARDYLRNRVAIVWRNKIAFVYALWARLRNVGLCIEIEALFTWGVDRASTWGVDRASTQQVDRVVTLWVDRAGTRGVLALSTRRVKLRRTRQTLWGECTDANLKTVAKRYMIENKLVPLHYES